MSLKMQLDPDIKLGHGHKGKTSSPWLQRSKKDGSTCYGRPGERSKGTKANMEEATKICKIITSMDTELLSKPQNS